MNVFENAQRQINKAYKVSNYMPLEENKLAVLLHPERVIEVNIPVKMDDGTVKVFNGYRSQHNDAR